MLAQLISVNQLVVQSDCSEVVSTMEQGGFSASSASAVYEECYSVWVGFDAISIEHGNRNANSGVFLKKKKKIM